MTNLPRLGSDISAYLALVLSMVFVGSSMTTNTFIVDDVPVMVAGLLRFIIAAIFILIITFAVDGGLPRLDRRSHLTVMAQSVFGSLLFTVLTLYGVSMTTAMISGIILAATPAMVAILSWIMGDRLSRIAWIGVLLTIGGVLVVNVLDAPDENVASRPVLGALLILLAVLSESLYTIFSRLVARRASPLGLTCWYSMYGVLLFLPLGVWGLRDFDLRSMPVSAWIALTYAGAFVGSAAAVLWYIGLRQLPTSVAGAVTGVMPIAAVLSAWLIAGDPFGWPHLVGMVLIVGGIVLVARSRGRSIERQAELLSG